jgi:hypothetical protein
MSPHGRVRFLLSIGCRNTIRAELVLSADAAARSVELLGQRKSAILNRRSQCLCAVLIITGGLRCPDLIQRHQALIGLGGVVLFAVRSLEVLPVDWRGFCFGRLQAASLRVRGAARPGALSFPAKVRRAASEVSNFEQTIAVASCCLMSRQSNQTGVCNEGRNSMD